MNDPLRDWLRSPSAYKHQVDHVDVVETHISWVYLTGEFAYKQKKPLRFDFLDFETLESRRFACEEEVRLNRRLAPHVYRGVAAVYRTPDGFFTWTESGEAVEYLVCMKQLPVDRRLDVCIQQRSLTDSERSQLLETLRTFYRNAHTLCIAPADYHQELTSHVLANRHQLLDSARDETLRNIVKQVHTAQLVALQLHKDLFDTRVERGQIVDGHGDLRPEHIYLLDEPAIIDCIEFNAKFRQIDIADELAFLAIELVQLGAEQLGSELLHSFFQSHPEPAPPELMGFYQTYRACVRAKVTLLRAEQLTGEEARTAHIAAEAYLHAARRYANALSGPILIVVAGLMGTGKSTLAHEIGRRLGIDVVSTDLIRREQFGQSEIPAAFAEGSYSKKNRDTVYAEMLARARTMLADGQSAILDGTFVSDDARKEVAALAADVHRSAFVQCSCPDDVAKQRIADRQRRGDSLSEARPELYELQKQAMKTISTSGWSAVDTTAPLEAQVKTALADLRKSL